MKKCIFCSSTISDDSRFCNFCGKDLSNIVYKVQCPKCYQINVKGSIFCSWCGLDLSKEKLLRTFASVTDANSSSQAPPVIAKNLQKDITGIKTAAILIFIEAGVFALITVISLWQTMAYGVEFNYALHAWNVLMTVFEVFVGIKVIKLSKKGYGQGLWMSGVGVIWYVFQAINLSWSIGYFLAILCVVTFILLKKNEKLFTNQ